MKKLLLILFCLFVTFEVRSSDDLTGKNLLCEDEFGSLGFEFISKDKVIRHSITDFTHDTLLGDYNTNVQSININLIYKGVLDFPENYFIRRDTLQVDNSKTYCVIYKGDIKEYFSKRLLEIKKYFKERNKI